jgi:DMSO/TMAO reductase YedYZ heme-binding membrane subunit
MLVLLGRREIVQRMGGVLAIRRALAILAILLVYIHV